MSDAQFLELMITIRIAIGAAVFGVIVYFWLKDVK